MTTPLAQEPLSPWGHTIYNFGRVFHGRHYYAIRILSEIYMGVEKIFKEIMHFQYMTGAMTQGSYNLQFW